MVILNHQDDANMGYPLHWNPPQGQAVIDAAKGEGDEETIWVLDSVYLSAEEIIRDLEMLKHKGD